MTSGWPSGRLPGDLSANAVTLAVRARLEAGGTVLDLTESNPTRVGLGYPPDLLAPLADPAGLFYDPQPLGRPAARLAISADLARHHLHVDPGRIALTASTSEAYSLLFKLFCDPGQNVLVPRPSYPLFEHLTRLEAIEAVPYDLEYHGSWRVDTASLAAAVNARTKAVLVVSPNNPTGSYLHRDDLADITELCSVRGLPIIGDEVFFDYPLDLAPAAVSVLSRAEVLTCALGGLSKSVGLPQVKLGWIAWGGPAATVAAALQAYEIIADSYLSVSTPVQIAVPALLANAAVVREMIRGRIRGNLDRLRTLCDRHPDVTLLRVEGGWSAVLQIPAIGTEEQVVLDLVRQSGVLVHPGYFFDFTRGSFVVVSLIVAPDRFDEGMAIVLARVSGGVS